MRRLAALATIVTFAGSARADDDDRSPETATRISVGITAGGAALFAAGIALEAAAPCNTVPRSAACNNFTAAGWAPLLVGGTAFAIGPSLGHLYADAPRSWRDRLGPSLRIGAVALALFGSLANYGVPDDSIEPTRAQQRWEIAILSTAAAMWIAGTVWDLATAGDAARRHNRARRGRSVEVAFTGRGAALAVRF